VKRALRILRDVTKAGGGSRDLDVGLSLFEERLAASAAAPDLRLLRRRLRSARTRSRTRMVGELLDLPISRLRRQLSMIAGRGGEDVFSVMSRLRDAGDRGAVLLETLDALGDRFDAGELHKLRVGVRRLRYSVEVMDFLKGQRGEAPALLKKLQEHLGRLHDAHVLSAWLGRQAEGFERRDQPALAAAARAEERHFEEVSREEHRVFLESQPREAIGRALESLGRGRSAA
jgi:CHAD domain-containing protein